MEMKALKRITEKDYLDLAQNGARVLFDLEEYRVLDGMKDETESYFVKHFSTDEWYLIDMKTCYDLVTMHYCGGYEPYLLECLEDIVASV